MKERIRKTTRTLGQQLQAAVFLTFGGLLTALLMQVAGWIDLGAPTSPLHGTAWTLRLSQWTHALPEGVPVALVIALVPAVGLCLLAAGSRLRSARDPGPYFLLSANSAGFIVLERNSLVAIIKAATLHVRGVAQVDVHVQKTQEAAVRLRLRAYVTPGTDIALASQDLQQRARDAVEQQTGLAVSDASVYVQVLQPQQLQAVFR